MEKGNEVKTVVPALRFPEFREMEGWRGEKLISLCDIINGKCNAQDHIEGGKYPLFDRSAVVKYSNNYLYDCEAIIIPGEGVRFIPKYYNGKFNLHQRAYALKDFSCNGKFLFYCMEYNSGLLAVKAVKSTVLSLRIPILQNFPLHIPFEEVEQQKIADCLSSLDELIEATNRKIEALKEHKKGLMQRLFPKEEENVPELRFLEFQGTKGWDKCILGDSLLEHPRYGINAPAVPFQKELATYIRITDISENGTFSPNPKVSVNKDNVDNFYLSTGDLVFARTGASVGKCYKYREKDGKLVFAGFLIKITPNSTKLLSDFLFQYTFSEQYWEWVHLTSTRSGQPGINSKEFFSMPFRLPTIQEQQKIAACLSSLDELIEATSQKVEILKEHKKGLMQQLFPKI